MKRAALLLATCLVLTISSGTASASHGKGRYYLNETGIEVDDNIGVGTSIANWNTAISTANLYSLGGTSNDDIILNYGNATAACGSPAIACAASFYDSARGGYYYVLTIDPNYINSSGELRQVAEHEIGHALGLNHSGDANSVMYAPGINPSRYITSHDAATVDNQIRAAGPLPTRVSNDGPPAVEADTFGRKPASFNHGDPVQRIADTFGRNLTGPPSR